MKPKTQHVLSLILIVVVCVCVVTTCWAQKAIEVSKKEGKITLTGEISKNLGTYEEHLQGAVEYLICGRGGKEYESIIVVDSKAQEILDAMQKLGVKKGVPPTYDEEQDAMVSPKGTGVIIHVEWTQKGKKKRMRAEELLYNVRTKKPMKHVAWTFSGSRMVPDLESDDEDAMIPQAFMGNDIVALNHLDGSTLFQNPLPEAAEENTYKKNEKTLPPLGTPVKVIIEVGQKMQRHILISGKVQGVGFRFFTQQNALKLGITGYVKNLPNGKVEAVVEGDPATLDQLVALLRKGPSPARVNDVKITKRQFSGKYKSFEIEY